MVCLHFDFPTLLVRYCTFQVVRNLRFSPSCESESKTIARFRDHGWSDAVLDRAYLMAACCSRDKAAAGDTLRQEVATWLKDESEARQQLTANAKTLSERLQLMDTSLAQAEQTVSDLQKNRDILQCKLTEIGRAQLASAATHTAELDKLEHKVQDALAAKDELYRDLVAVQQAKGELKEELVRKPILTSMRGLYG